MPARDLDRFPLLDDDDTFAVTAAPDRLGAESDSTVTISRAPSGHTSHPAFRSEGHGLAPGEQVAERYRILHFIARGAVGEVYAALDEELGIAVALKTLRPERGGDAAAVARFRREVLLSRELGHPGVCRVFDLGVHDGTRGRTLFLTMELIAGETLADRLARTGPLASAAARRLAGKLASALAAIHAAGVVHRDLKPANIMLVADERAADGERVVITDFGLARRPEAPDLHPSATDVAHDDSIACRVQDAWATANGAMIGSPAYMAPEQVAGREVGPAVDIYALGVVLFEAVTGRLPFLAETALAMAASRLDRDPPGARSVRPDLDPRWEAALARCLARDPAHRFARADDLPRALGDTDEDAPPESGRARAPRRSIATPCRARRTGPCRVPRSPGRGR